MLDLTRLLSNKGPEQPAAAPQDGSDRLTELRSTRAQLQTRLHEIGVEVAQAQDAGDQTALANLRDERGKIHGQLSAITEDEAHAVRRAQTATYAKARDQIARERELLAQRLPQHGEAIEACCRQMEALLDAYSDTWEATEAWNRRADAHRQQFGGSFEPLVATVTAGLADSGNLNASTGSNLLTAARRVVDAVRRLDQRREWASPEAVARRAAQAEQERQQRAREYNTPASRKQRGVIERFTAHRYGGALDADRRR